MLRSTAGFPGGGEEGQHQGAALATSEHDKLRVQRELVRARGTDGSAPVSYRRQPGAGQTAGQVRGGHPSGQQGRLERATHRRVWGPPGHCVIPHH